jgi:DMSO/TMAO reductase YedYZ molybdopterin-dependent catalytic subunit
MKRFQKSMLVLTLLMAMLTACAQTATEEASSGGHTTLSITGNVDSEMSWSYSELQSMDSINVETTNKDGETVENSGVSLLNLLEEAGLQDGVASLTFVGSDGYEATVDFVEVEACSDCIVALQEDGELKMVLPELSGKYQVKGVVEIRVE